MSGVRDRLAARATVAVGSASRTLRLGGGSVVGGRVGLAVSPDLLRVLASERRVALVSGTNGKTTTTRLLASALAGVQEPGGARPVATSTAGANLPPGIVAALAGAEPGAPAVIEVDEAYLAAVADAVRPEAVVLLNLSRDQLDRVSEVRSLATRWRAAMTRMAEATVVANADDPLVAWAASTAPWPRWVAAGQRWRQDATGCPACDGRIEFGDSGDWWCEGCGMRRPAPDAELHGRTLVMADGRRFEVSLSLPGRFNVANAAMAAVAASALGIDVGDALAAMATVEEVEGRFARVPVGELTARLLLAKNPAGWAELLDLVEGSQSPVVLGINAQIADGRDPSWLWDVAFERLQGRLVVATGERAHDLAVRLRHAGVAHRVVPDQMQALHTAAAGATTAGTVFGGGGSAAAGGALPGLEVDYIGNYTAFQELRRHVGRGRARSAPVVVAEHPASPVVPARRASASAGPSALRIVVVHPDLLGTYGDGGNGLVLANRAAWRGLDAELVLVHAEDEVPTSGDVYLLGGGEDGPQVQAAELLGAGQMRRAVDRGATVLAVCAGFQVAGASFPGADNQPRPGLGLLDVTTAKRRAPRAVGELLALPVPAADDRRSAGVAASGDGVARAAAGDAGTGTAGDAVTGSAGDGVTGSSGDVVTLAAAVLEAGGPLTGFENHGGGTTLGDGVPPLGTVVVGVGNDGTGPEGAWSGRVIGTYLHGPVLARNPALADALLTLATGSVPTPLDDREEEALRRRRISAFPRRVRARVDADGAAVDGSGQIHVRRAAGAGRV